MGGWTFEALANHVWSFAGDSHRELVNTTLGDPFTSYGWKNDFAVEFDGESTYDWEQEQGTVPRIAGVSRVVTLGKQSVSIGLDGRWYDEQAAGGPEWGVVFIPTLLVPKSIQ